MRSMIKFLPLLFISFFAIAKNNPGLNSFEGPVGIGVRIPNPKAILDITSITQGILDPRLSTTQRNAITSVPQALRVFDTNLNAFFFHDGSVWHQMADNDTAFNISNKTYQFPAQGTPTTPPASNIKLFSRSGTDLRTFDASATERIVQTTPQEVHVSYTLNNTSSAAACTGTGFGVLVKYSTAVYDANSNYSSSTGLFTAPVAGKYTVRASTSFAISTPIMTIQKNGSSILYRGFQNIIPNVNVVINLAQGDTLAFGVCSENAGTQGYCTTLSSDTCYMMIDRIGD